MSKSARTAIFIIMALAIIGLGVTVAYLVLGNKGANEPASNTTGNDGVATSGSAIVLTEDTKDDINALVEKLQDNSLAVKMTGTWTFSKDCTTSNAFVANSERNKHPLRVTVVMADTGEEIITLPDMEVGQKAENFGLPMELEPGEYEAVMMHQTIVDGEVHGTVNTALTIVVLDK